MPRSESARSAPCVWLAVLLAATAAGGTAASAAQNSDTIYNENTFATFRLTMNPADWQKITDDPAGQGDTWQRADMDWQGEIVPGVGVKASGQGTTAPRQKQSIRISFNEFEFANPAGPGSPGRKWRDVNRIKLDSMIGNTDAAMMRDRLAYWTFRQAGAPASRASHAKLYVNDDYKGVYTVEEPVRKDFVRQRWNEDTGNLYYLFCNTPVGAGDGFAWWGNDPASYVPAIFTAETNYPGGDYRDLVTTCDILNNFPQAQRRTELDSRILNVDGLLTYMAAFTAVTKNDGIFAGNVAFFYQNNTYFYHRVGTNRIEIVEWDPGNSLGLYERDPANGAHTRWDRDIWWCFDQTALTSWIQADATANAAYKDKIRQILDGPWAGVQARIDFIYNQIKDDVYREPYKPFSNAEFDAEKDYLKNWFNRRSTYLRSRVGGPPPTLPTVTISASTPNAAEPSTPGAFTFTRTGPTTSDLAVSRPRTGTAISGTDFVAMPNPVVIPAGQSSVTVAVTPIDDTLVEGDETVILTLSSTPTYNVGAASSATVTIADDDGVPPPPTLPTVTISASTPNAAEPSTPGAFTFMRTGPTTSDLAVSRPRTGTAISGTDFVAMSNPVVIPAGQSSVTVPVTPIDDTDVEGDETVILTLSSTPTYNVGAASSATVTIADNDGVPPPPTLATVTIVATDPNAAEPSSLGAFTVSRTGPTTADLTVPRVRTGTAQSGIDFTGVPSPIVIPAGQSSVTLTIAPIDDTAGEGDETVILTISPNAAYTVGTASSATVTIADDETSTGTGLSATYYDNSDFTGTSVTRTDPTVDFNWADQAPAAGIGADTFSIRWTGRVRAQHSETYTFYTFTNDGVRLWVEGELLVDKWVQQSGGIEWSAQMDLQAGRWYTVQMDYYENLGFSTARLLWSSPSTAKQVIPQSALYDSLGVPDSRDNDGDGIPNDADLDDDNDGIPDLQDPDRDGDTLTNIAEVAAGSDPDDRNSPTAGGGPGSTSDGDNPNGNAWINDKCAGSIGAGHVPTWALLILGLVFLAAVKGARSLRDRDGDGV